MRAILAALFFLLPLAALAADDQPVPAAGEEQFTEPLGPRGGISESELWRELRGGQGKATSQIQEPGATVLVQDTGIEWLRLRQGPLPLYGVYFLLGILAITAVFFLIRGRIPIAGGRAGVRIERFRAVERFAHWLLAGSFILLGITGLISLFGRKALIPYLGHETFSTVATNSKWLHNNVSWGFMLGLAMVFALWVYHNLPDRTDLAWALKGGGLVGKGHPPARKFNAGQKLIFWSVVLLGGSISATGLALLFPFEFNMFAPTFAKLNAMGVPGWFGFEALPATLTPQAEMQLSQLWHAVASFLLLGIILAHIYIGTLGMEGASAAMVSGEVDLNWAKQHHSLWVDEVRGGSGEAPKGAAPAA